jgi:hypothetical protein
MHAMPHATALRDIAKSLHRGRVERFAQAAIAVAKASPKRVCRLSIFGRSKQARRMSEPKKKMQKLATE